MIDYHKLIEHIDDEIEFHSQQCDKSPSQNSGWFAMHMGAVDALNELKEYLND